MTDVLVVGGGPAGMMAALAAADNGKSVLLLEKNDRLGKNCGLPARAGAMCATTAEMMQWLLLCPETGVFCMGRCPVFPRRM